ncbi:cytochrome b/b6 domain-containing protein [Microbacterium alkaliflavum]|uniref:cytochrome b/b6 domain-containing protein n=1 Tax=Microbacterium alkaliflavum TaxID=3248839 RepID=UPI0037CAFF96
MTDTNPPAAADPNPVAEPVEASNSAPARSVGTSLRRGLPRVAGGEPWPSGNGAGPAAVAEPVLPRQVAGAAAADPQIAAAEAPTPVVPPREVAGAAAADPQIAAGEGGDLRRGLPRVAGGEAWPSASATRAAATAAAAATAGAAATAATATAAAAPATTEVAEHAASEPATPQDAAPERPVRRGLPRTAEPTQVQVTESADAPAETAVVVVASHPSTSSGTEVAERAPLPFTRTVWPGAAAQVRPEPKPEPTRIGPFTKGQWAGAVIVGGAGLLFAAGMVVLFTRWLLSLSGMQEFLATYPGEYELPAGAPVGIPPWLGWQHFFNVFLMVLIIRSGLTVRSEKRPSVFWSPRSNGRRKMSLTLWFHQALDVLWIVNGVIFIVLLFVTGQWMKIVPTSWTVFPNALSAALQYVSLDWPTENGWVNYNSLQQLAYFATVFIAAPLAIITGVRMSHVWPKNAVRLSKAYNVEWARAVHFPVMLYFVLFIIVHVTLVFATGALRNLNHMYASQDAVNWVGFWIFTASLVVIAAGWIAARPLVLAPIARLFGKVSGR